MNVIKRTIAALVAAAVLAFSSGCGKTESSEVAPSEPALTQPADNTGSVGEQNHSGAEESQAEQTQSEQSQNEQTSPAEGSEAELSVSFKTPSSWESGGMSFAQFDVTVSNNSAASTSGWTVELTFDKAIELDTIWNGSCEINGSAMTVTNADYNGAIAANGSTDFGFIVKAASEPTISGARGVGAAAEPLPAEPAQPEQAPEPTAPVTETDPSAPAEITAEVTGRYGLVSECGQLSVKGADLVDKDGNPVQLRGISTHGIQWFPQFVNKEAFKTLRDDWNVNVIRVAMYSGESEGYTASASKGIEQTLQQAVDACIELDMYVIIDWHVLADQSPIVRKDDAVRFFREMSRKYADYPNVIYEICNEPNGYATWEGDIKPYAEEVIPVIRENAPDSVVIVGTPTWSQDIDKALSNPLAFDNVMYALHFYAATHTDWLRDRLKSCYNSGLPVFVSEFGLCDASGGGANDFNQSKAWLELMDGLKISYCAWALADKNETCCLLKPGANANGSWSDSELNESGKYMKEWLSTHN